MKIHQKQDAKRQNLKGVNIARKQPQSCLKTVQKSVERVLKQYKNRFEIPQEFMTLNEYKTVENYPEKARFTSAK